nr:MAG TPA: hypothetical protein [Caudoviricetes sp.]
MSYIENYRYICLYIEYSFMYQLTVYSWVTYE